MGRSFMANHRANQNPPDGGDQLPVPAHSDLIVLVPDERESGLLVETAPHWIAQWLGKSAVEIQGERAGDVFGGTLDALPTLAEDILEEGAPIDEYVVEFQDSQGKPRAITLSAERIDHHRPLPESRAAETISNSGPAVVFRVKDVTRSVRQDHRLAGIGVYHGIIGRSKLMLQVFYKIDVYGPSEAPVVISGETGTGKELVARALHDRSRRRESAFVAVNCTALSEELFESELFGHEQGAFTGATRAHKGRFERADKGTLFLDEIGDMPLRTQAKLLRALEQGMIERVGGEREHQVNVRVLAATNISLEQAVAVRRFRADLYHRLSVFRIHVPALRDRMDDLPLLVNHFMELLNRRYGRRVRLTPEATRLLQEYHWPGNIRELRNVLERVYVEAQAPVIGRNAFSEWVRERDFLTAGGWNLEHLDQMRALTPYIVTPHRPGGAPGAGPPHPALPESADWPTPDATRFPLARSMPEPYGTVPPQAVEATYRVIKPSRKPAELSAGAIRQAFTQAKGNATKAAGLLGVHKATLYRNMKTLGLTRESLETE